MLNANLKYGSHLTGEQGEMLECPEDSKNRKHNDSGDNTAWKKLTEGENEGDNVGVSVGLKEGKIVGVS